MHHFVSVLIIVITTAASVPVTPRALADDSVTVRVSVGKMLDDVKKVHSPATYEQLVLWASSPGATQHTDLLDRLFQFEGEGNTHPGYMDYAFDALVLVLRIPQIQAHPSFANWAAWVARAAHEEKVDYVAQSHGLTFPAPVFPPDLLDLARSCRVKFQ